MKTSQFNHAALIEHVNAAKNPAREAMAIIGSMSGVITFELGGAAAAQMLRMCADLTERWPDSPDSLDEFNAALKDFLQ